MEIRMDRLLDRVRVCSLTDLPSAVQGNLSRSIFFDHLYPLAVVFS